MNLLQNLLAMFDACPSSAGDWVVACLDDGRRACVADARSEATTLELAAIAGRHGTVEAETVFQSHRSDGNSIVGVLVRFPGDDIQSGEGFDADDPLAATGRLRAAVALATAKRTDDGSGSGPF